MGKSCKKQATEVETISYATHHKRSRWIKVCLLLMIMVILITAWGVVIHLQVSGSFLCGTVQVQFGDDFLPAIGTFSGLYDMRTSPYKPFQHNKVEYVERRAVEIGSKLAKFSYCDQLGAWIFQIEPSDGSTIPCEENWIAKSASTTTYDFSKTGSLQWTVRNNFGQEVVLDPFYLVCFECNSEEDCGGRGICGSSSDNPFDRNVCLCDEGSGAYGNRCQFRSPCTTISVDSETPPFVSTRAWADSYERFILNGDPIDAYGRPVSGYFGQRKSKRDSFRLTNISL